MKRIYIAGAYTHDNHIQVLNNIAKGMRMGTRVLLAGFAPFVPWFDYQFQFMLRDGEELTIEDYYTYSMAWLDVSDAVLVLPDWQDSKGTKAEIERAITRNIPIYFSLEHLIKEMSCLVQGLLSLHTGSCENG